MWCLALFENTVQTLVLVEEHIISPLKTGTKLFLIGIFSIALGHLVDFPNNLSQVFSILSRTEVAAGAPCSGQAPKHALVRAIARGVDATLGIRRDGCYWRSHRWFSMAFQGLNQAKPRFHVPKMNKIIAIGSIGIWCPSHMHGQFCLVFLRTSGLCKSCPVACLNWEKSNMPSLCFQHPVGGTVAGPFIATSKKTSSEMKVQTWEIIFKPT